VGGPLGFLLTLSNMPISVGPTFTTAESLAYDVVYETAGADASSIEPLQTQTAGMLHAVLVGYEIDGEANVRLIVARDNGREFFVETMQAGAEASDEHLTAVFQRHHNGLESEVAIYGRLLNPSISRVTITWPSGYQRDAILSQGSYLLFQGWSVADGSIEPSTVTGYDAAGHIVDQLSLPSISP
jgi:hypothetical protein